MPSLQLKIPPPIVGMFFAALMWSTPSPYNFESDLNLWAAVLFFLAGLFIAILGTREFAKKKTTIDPRRPQESQALVTDGIYRFTRNPMYLGLLLWLVAFAVYLGHPLAIGHCFFFVLYISAFQILPEERLLLEKFGESYRDYMESVRRWI